MTLSDQNLREKEFHNKLQSKSTGRFENIFYKAIYNSSEDFFNFLKLNSSDSDILDYGCGVGNSIKRVIDYNPKKITGIDISEVSIQKAKDSIRLSDFTLPHRMARALIIEQIYRAESLNLGHPYHK